MRCEACGTVNNPGRIYCGGCARVIGEVCPVCSFVNEPTNRYCGGCARDLLAAVAEQAPAARADACGPTAPAAAAAPGKRSASPPAKGDRRGLLSDLEDLADLAGGIVPDGSPSELSSGPADTSQCDVDDFFQRLAREGVAEIASPGTCGLPIEPPRSASS